jgi:predicted RecB family endonuclease
MTEAQIQSAVMEHIATRGAKNCFAFHVPNGGYRNKIEAARLKRQGVKAGCPDIFIVKDGRAFALELKTEKGRMSPAQCIAFNSLNEAGATCFVAYGLDEALRALEHWGVLQ